MCYALPRLQARHSPLVATAVLAAVVAVWHVPLVLLPDEDLPPAFLVATVAVTFFYTWLYNHSGTDETRFAVLYAAGWCLVPGAWWPWRCWSPTDGRGVTGGAPHDAARAAAMQPA